MRGKTVLVNTCAAIASLAGLVTIYMAVGAVANPRALIVAILLGLILLTLVGTFLDAALSFCRDCGKPHK